MYYLMEILRHLKKVDAYEIKLKKNNKKAPKYKKLIETEEEYIDKSIEELKKFDQTDTTEVVSAYVTFRSMEGRERSIKAYNTGCCSRFF
jgi:hypothetical protein